MANLQIEGIDDDLYREIREMAKDEHRSVSQQILYMTKLFLTRRKAVKQAKTSAEILLELAGSWDDERPAEEIVAEIREARKSSARLSDAGAVDVALCPLCCLLNQTQPLLHGHHVTGGVFPRRAAVQEPSVKGMNP